MCVCVWGGEGRHWTHLTFQTPFVAHIDPKVKWCLLDNHPRFYHLAFRQERLNLLLYHNKVS